MICLGFLFLKENENLNKKNKYNKNKKTLDN